MEVVQTHESSTPLRQAAIQGQLSRWTTALTHVVCGSCAAVGWESSAKGHTSTLLPVSRSEYLALDVVASNAKENGGGDSQLQRSN